LAEELEIAGLEPKEAHTKFVARVNNFKQVKFAIIAAEVLLFVTDVIFYRSLLRIL
jgi:hypothetical protein